MDSLWKDTPMRVRRQCYDRFQKALAVYLYDVYGATEQQHRWYDLFFGMTKNCRLTTKVFKVKSKYIAIHFCPLFSQRVSQVGHSLRLIRESG